MKEQYGPAHNFSCYYYYKRWTKWTTAIAGIVYLADCSQCAYKDKEGDPVDFPCYNLSRETADSLRALRFDTTGYRQDAVVIGAIGVARRVFLSSPSSAKALLVEQAPTWHTVTELTKRKVGGQQRYYVADDNTEYFLIDRSSGLVEHYTNGELDGQDALDN